MLIKGEVIEEDCGDHVWPGMEFEIVSDDGGKTANHFYISHHYEALQFLLVMLKKDRLPAKTLASVSRAADVLKTDRIHRIPRDSEYVTTAKKRATDLARAFSVLKGGSLMESYIEIVVEEE